MSAERDKMIKSLKEIVIPELRNRNFKGSFPHFRKTENTKTNLLTFQFDRNGGGFIIELANWNESEFKTYWGEIIPLNKLTSSDLHPDERQRIYPNSLTEQSGTDSWFRFGKPKSDEIYGILSEKVLNRIPIMEQYWTENKIEEKGEIKIMKKTNLWILIILGLIPNIPTSIYIVKQSIGGHSIFGFYFGVLLPILSLVFYFSYLNLNSSFPDNKKELFKIMTKPSIKFLGTILLISILYLILTIEFLESLMIFGYLILMISIPNFIYQILIYSFMKTRIKNKKPVANNG